MPKIALLTTQVTVGLLRRVDADHDQPGSVPLIDTLKLGDCRWQLCTNSTRNPRESPCRWLAEGVIHRGRWSRQSTACCAAGALGEVARALDLGPGSVP